MLHSRNGATTDRCVRFQVQADLIISMQSIPLQPGSFCIFPHICLLNRPKFCVIIHLINIGITRHTRHRQLLPLTPHSPIARLHLPKMAITRLQALHAAPLLLLSLPKELVISPRALIVLLIKLPEELCFEEVLGLNGGDHVALGVLVGLARLIDFADEGVDDAAATLLRVRIGLLLE